jgi:glycosyltransferase involved in cell wall biosynthesis
MRVTVAVGGTFHAFRLAEQLSRRGLLQRLVTTHRPLRGEQIPAERLVANPLPEILMRGPRRLGLRWEVGDYLKAVAFDRWAVGHVSDCDLLVGFALFSLWSSRRARACGAHTVLERGSTHILTQQALLAEEHRRWGADTPPVDRRLLARQLAEYDEAEYISVPSRFVLESFLAHGFARERLVQLPYGVHLEQFVRAETPGRPFRIVAAGLGLRKGTPYLLEAVARLNLPDLELHLVGAVPPGQRAILDRARVPFRHLGGLSQIELARVYRGASVFVLPSVEEGLALVILEAMASGLPVVVTPNTGAEDIVTDGREGMIVPARDAGALAEALRTLYEDEPRRRAMGAAAASAAASWSWDAYGDRVAAAYARIAGRPGTPT